MIRLAPILFLLFPLVAGACPPWARCAPPGPVVYYQPGYRGPCCSNVYPQMRLLEVREAEIPRVVVNDGAP